MTARRAHVEDGRIIVDDPTDLPEGTALRVITLTDGEEVDAAWREEARRRSAHLRSGLATATPWDKARREIFGG